MRTYTGSVRVFSTQSRRLISGSRARRPVRSVYEVGLDSIMNGALVRFLTVVLGSVGLACLLGICVDLVTANVAVEYFSVHHPRIVDTEQPWLLAIVWGVGASWWFGAIGGALVGAVNHRRQQPLPPARILAWVAIACSVLWLIMIAIVIAIFVFAGTIPVEQRRPTFESDRRLMAVALAHQFEYVFGGVALLILLFKTWKATSGADGPARP